MKLIGVLAFVSLMATVSSFRSERVAELPASVAVNPLTDTKQRKAQRCGTRPLIEGVMGKIMGGTDAVRGQFPWQARLMRRMPDQSEALLCGAVIINENWLLSAAHCISDTQNYITVDKSTIRVYVGDNHLFLPEHGEQVFDVDRLINHEDYDYPTLQNDIALIKIQQKNSGGIQFGDFAQPSCLPDSTTPYTEGTECWVSGWGDTEQGYPYTLKAVKVPIINQQWCESIYSECNTHFKITDRMLCAGIPYERPGHCFGDSGGPLVCKTGDVHTLYGIVSFRDCVRRRPSGYTRVSSYLSWIESTVKAAQ